MFFMLTPRFDMISAALHAERYQHTEIAAKKKKKMNEQTFILTHTSSRK